MDKAQIERLIAELKAKQQSLVDQTNGAIQGLNIAIETLQSMLKDELKKEE